MSGIQKLTEFQEELMSIHSVILGESILITIEIQHCIQQSYNCESVGEGEEAEEGIAGHDLS